MRYPLSTTLKTRTGVPEGKDARLKNAYVEVRGEQSVVRKRPQAQGGVPVGTGTAQGGIGLTVGGVDYIYTVNGDVGALDTLATAGTTWNSGTSYVIGDHESYNFVDYWALTDHSNSQPPSADWSTSYVSEVPNRVFRIIIGIEGVPFSSGLKATEQECHDYITSILPAYADSPRYTSGFSTTTNYVVVHDTILGDYSATYISSAPLAVTYDMAPEITSISQGEFFGTTDPDVGPSYILNATLHTQNIVINGSAILAEAEIYYGYPVSFDESIQQIYETRTGVIYGNGVAYIYSDW